MAAKYPSVFRRYSYCQTLPSVFQNYISLYVPVLMMIRLVVFCISTYDFLLSSKAQSWINLKWEHDIGMVCVVTVYPSLDVNAQSMQCGGGMQLLLSKTWTKSQPSNQTPDLAVCAPPSCPARCCEGVLRQKSLGSSAWLNSASRGFRPAERKCRNAILLAMAYSLKIPDRRRERGNADGEEVEREKCWLVALDSHQSSLVGV